MAHREGRLTARRLKPPSRLDQKTVSVSSTVSHSQNEALLTRGFECLGGENLRCASAVALGPSAFRVSSSLQQLLGVRNRSTLCEMDVRSHSDRASS